MSPETGPKNYTPALYWKMKHLTQEYRYDNVLLGWGYCWAQDAMIDEYEAMAELWFVEGGGLKNSLSEVNLL